MGLVFLLELHFPPSKTWIFRAAFVFNKLQSLLKDTNFICVPISESNIDIDSDLNGAISHELNHLYMKINTS